MCCQDKLNHIVTILYYILLWPLFDTRVLEAAMKVMVFPGGGGRGCRSSLGGVGTRSTQRGPSSRNKDTTAIIERKQ